MATKKEKPVFDGATLSPKLKPKGEVDPNLVVLPIGKSQGADGAAVARAYKHAAGKSNTYSPEVVDMIYHMAREGDLPDEQVGQFVRAKLAAERDSPHAPPPATLDQLVFLSANLTRLVIDPYRERCNSRVEIGPDRPRPLVLEWPIVFGGVEFARLPEPLWGWVLAAAAKAGLAVCVEAGPDTAGAAAPRILGVDATRPLPDLSGAVAVELTAPLASQLDRSTLVPVVEKVRELTESGIPVGVVVPACNGRAVIDHSIDLGVDFYVCDAQWTEDARPEGIFPELGAAPAIHVMADTIECLRHHRMEDLVQIIYRGGIRGGADAGKVICLGATAVTLGLSAVVGMGFTITRIDSEEGLIKQLGVPIDDDEAVMSMYRFAKSVNVEITMLARACGKTSVLNMEPEDLRALTIAVSAATGVPLTGKDLNFRSVVK